MDKVSHILMTGATEFISISDIAPEGFILNPFRLWGAGDELESALAKVSLAYDLAIKAADPTFLAVPQGLPPDAAMAHSKMWTQHVDAAAKAAAHLHSAKRDLLAFHSKEPPLEDAVKEASLTETQIFGIIFSCKKRIINEQSSFI